jgi:nucleotide-binding universal stress UspA family protein
MAIICGIDFSESSTRAANVAAVIAGRRKEPLHLVHCLADWEENVFSDETDALAAIARRTLDKEAEKLRASGVEVHTHVEMGAPDSVLIPFARRHSATLLVFGATGRNKADGQPVGRSADRIAQKSDVPALVVRDPEPFEAWAKGERPLRVLVGLDFNLVTDAAWRWALDLGRVGPTETIGTFAYWPPQEFQRLGLGGARSYVDRDPEVEKVILRELQERFTGGAPGRVKLRAEPTIGKPADHLLSVSTEEEADLIVVGSHQRSKIAHLWEGSVSRGVLHYARGSVACIPPPAQVAPRMGSEIRTALAATDFSPTGNAGVECAYRQVGRGGKVYLVHVVDPPPGRSALEPTDILPTSASSAETHKELFQKLLSLVPMRAILDDKETEPLVLESRDVATAIVQAADRLGVDILCLGTQGRTGVSSVLMGSIAQRVLAQTQKPLLLTRAPRE